MGYFLEEGARIIIQIIFGSEIFSCPCLLWARGQAYRLIFKIGRKPTIGKNVRLYRTHQFKDGKIKIGKNILLAGSAEIDYSGEVIIGNNVWISEGVQIYSHEHRLTRNRVFNKKDGILRKKIKIGDNVWIGTRSIVLPTVGSIGKNSIIGAGSIVTKSVPQNVIAAGNPTKIIKKLKMF